MSLINVENLSFAYPGSTEKIFDNVTFQLDSTWKLGLIGRNGKGKTTLLNLLCGKLPYQGKIHAAVQFDYFPYPVADDKQAVLQVLTSVCPQAQEWEFLRELSYLEVGAEILDRPFCQLSAGERTKVLLAALFLQEGRLLLIDEPTDHLDMQARLTVAAYLKRKQGFILVSHDRNFLDDCVDHIMSINRSDIEICSGNFSVWFDNFRQRQDFEHSQNEKLKKEISAMKKAAARTAVWSARVEATKIGYGPCDRGYIGHKAAKMMKRSKAIETRRERAVKEKSQLLKNSEKVEVLKIVPEKHFATTLVAFSEVVPLYNEQAVCSPVTFALEQGERIVLKGRNGAGKSSLLKLLTGEHKEFGGTLKLAPGLTISYVPQDTSSLRGSLKIFAHESGIDESLFKTILRKMDFARALFDMPMETFSAGQKKKVLLAKSLCERAHLYVWDEPLNYIDIYSRIQIENLLKEFAPTMIFVEHDVAFQKAIATATVTLTK